MTWKDKAIAATHGNEWQLGAILLCAFDRNEPDAAPAFHGKASVTSDGFVMCNFTSRDGDHHSGAFIGTIDDLLSNVAGLAAHLKLNDAEHEAFNATIKAWIGRDWRN